MLLSSAPLPLPRPQVLTPDSRVKGKDKRLNTDELFTGGSGQQLLQATKQSGTTRKVLTWMELTEEGALGPGGLGGAWQSGLGGLPGSTQGGWSRDRADWSP